MEKFIEGLLKNKFSPYKTDRRGRTALDYLLHKKVPQEIVHTILEMYLNHADFKVLQNPETNFGVEGEAFFFKLVRSGTASVPLLNLMKDQLLRLTIDTIENLLHDINKTDVVLKPDVEKFFKVLRSEVYDKSRKKCKVPALFTYHKLQENKENE